MKTDLLRSRPRLTAWTIALGVGIILGVVERVALWRTHALSFDSDEALAGLMAHDLWDGRYKIFLWGQPYGGTGEVFPVAVMIKLFGGSVFALRLTTLLLGAVIALLTWRVATRLMSPRSAAAAGVVMWTWPVAFVAWTMHEYLYYAPLMTLGLTAILASYRAVESGRARELALAGFCLGAGFWTSPYIAYFVLFCAIVLAPAWRNLWRRSWMPMAGAVVGASPWIAFNVTRSFASLRTPDTVAESTYLERIGYFFETGLPVIMGVRGWWHASWIHDSKLVAAAVAIVILLAIAIASGFALARFIRHREAFPADVVVLMLWPIAYALSPVASTAETYTPRYWVLVWPFLALVLARAMQHWLPAAAIACTLTLVGVAAMDDQRTRYVDWPETTALRQAMENEGVDRFYSGYWVAYRVTYESRLEMIGTPAFHETARSKRLDRIVAEDENPAWVFRSSEDANREFQSLMRHNGWTYRSVDTGDYVLHLPDRPVHRADVTEGLTILMG